MSGFASVLSGCLVYCGRYLDLMFGLCCILVCCSLGFVVCLFYYFGSGLLLTACFDLGCGDRWTVQ